MLIESLQKGAIRAPEDKSLAKFHEYPIFAAAQALVDWTAGFMNPEPASEDQQQSSSCVGHAWTYYHRMLRGVLFSIRDLYARIFQPGGGAYIQDGGSAIVNQGQATRDAVPDPVIRTEAAMEDKTGIPNASEAQNRELQLVPVQFDIDHWAAAIHAYKGIVGGLEGRNVDWQNLAVPNPPPPGQTDVWGHCLYFFGYHIHEDGQKCVIAKSSWGNAGNTTVHHIRQNYFDSGYMFNAFVLIPKEHISMYQRYIVFHQPTNREGVLVVGQAGFADAIVWADNPAHLLELRDVFQVPANAPTITLP